MSLPPRAALQGQQRALYALGLWIWADPVGGLQQAPSWSCFCTPEMQRGAFRVAFPPGAEAALQPQAEPASRGTALPFGGAHRLPKKRASRASTSASGSRRMDLSAQPPPSCSSQKGNGLKKWQVLIITCTNPLPPPSPALSPPWAPFPLLLGFTVGLPLQGGPGFSDGPAPSLAEDGGVRVCRAACRQRLVLSEGKLGVLAQWGVETAHSTAGIAGHQHFSCAPFPSRSAVQNCGVLLCVAEARLLPPPSELPAGCSGSPARCGAAVDALQPNPPFLPSPHCEPILQSEGLAVACFAMGGGRRALACS